MLPRYSAVVEPTRSAARRSGPAAAARAHAATNASTWVSDIRYHTDFSDPVHVGCREPSTRTEPRPTKPKPTPLKQNPVCPRCWTQHAGECL